MKIGLMVGSDKDRQYAERIPGFVADAAAAEAAGFTSMWVPQIPGYLDVLTLLTLMGQATERIELGTAVLPMQTRHPIAMAQQALTTQIVLDGRLTLGLGPSHHWIIEEQLGLSYDRPAHLVRNYLEVLNRSFSGPGPIDVENEVFRVHSPLDVTDRTDVPILLAALAPVMLGLAGEHASGTILWMADEQAIANHIAPRLTAAADKGGRPAPRIVAGVPVAICADRDVDAARETANVVLGHADYSPNYKRLLEQGNANDVGDVLAAGDEAAIEARLKSFRDAGVTDLSARVLPLGDTPEARAESKRRTLEFLSTLAPEL